MNEDILSLASDIVDKARRLGADEVDAFVVSSTESSVQVRRGAIERVIDAGSHAVGIRIIKDKRTALCSTADLTPKALEALVRDALERLMRGRTTLVVAHRLSTIRGADRIVVLKRGAVVREFAGETVSKDRLLEAA